MKSIAMTENLRDLLLIVRDDFGPKAASYAAKPYFDALLTVPNGGTRYHEDSVADCLMYLLGNITSWRGPLSKPTRQALKTIYAKG